MMPKATFFLGIQRFGFGSTVKCTLSSHTDNLTMPDVIDLELSLIRVFDGSYSSQIRISREVDDHDIRVASTVPVLTKEQLTKLNTLPPGGDDYNSILSGILTADASIWPYIQSTINEVTDRRVRFRLFLGSDAWELQKLRWEDLRHPEKRQQLFQSDWLYFSRYLSPSRLRGNSYTAKRNLKVLVVIADPTDLEENSFQRISKINPTPEESAFLHPFGNAQDITVDILGSQMGPATIENIRTRLSRGVDILYLICHGAFDTDGPILYLEDQKRRVNVVLGRVLVEFVRTLQKPPRLVVLASCESIANAAIDQASFMSSLGPGLASAGIPAVIGMQGKITIATASSMITCFFNNVLSHGEIDRAMASARHSVKMPDSWMPALFLSSKSGRLWQSHGIDQVVPELDFSPIVQQITDGTCLPIVGSGLSDHICGSLQDIALQWSQNNSYPLLASAQAHLPEVADFLKYNLRADYFPHADLRNQACRNANQHLGEYLVGLVDYSLSITNIDARVEEAYKTNPLLKPFMMLAHLPFTVFITSAYDSLLSYALRCVGKVPSVGVCNWNPRCHGYRNSIRQRDKTTLKPPFYLPDSITPSIKEPIVYHLHGSYADHTSMVVTIDDYFKFLQATALKEGVMPHCVRSAFVQNTFLFLGYQIVDWDFRVLFHSIMYQEGERDRLPHVAVQFDPDKYDFLSPKRAKRYFDKLFGTHNVDLYMGSAPEFLSELDSKIPKDK